MKRKACIIKPGFDLQNLFVKDYTAFGGLYEIYGLKYDLEKLNFNVTMNIIPEDCCLVFIFSSGFASQNDLIPILNFKRTKIQCVTDLTIQFDEDELGEHLKLYQIPTSKYYYPFEQSIFKFVPNPVINDWNNREHNLVYAGGSRNGKRNIMFDKYINQCNAVDIIFTSSNHIKRKK